MRCRQTRADTAAEIGCLQGKNKEQVSNGCPNESEGRWNAPAGQNEPGTHGTQALPNAPAAHKLKPVSDRKANMGRKHKSKQPGDSDAGATEKHTHTHEANE